MPPFQKLAKHLVAEVPVGKLQVILQRKPVELPADGGFCGVNCDGGFGLVCGGRCRPSAEAPGVIDREGRLGLTAKDLAGIRNDLPKLRQAVARQIEAQLDKLR